MKLLICIFLSMFVYGLVTSQLAGALLALVMAGFVYYASKRFAAQDSAYANDPSNAPAPLTTQQVLDDACVECSCPKDRP